MDSFSQATITNGGLWALGHATLCERTCLMRFIDLSAPIAPSHPGARPYERIEIQYTGHAEGARRSRPC